MRRVIDGISLKAYPGEVTALLGANGAGKTTTIECAQGLLPRNGGKISLLGQDPAAADARLRARVGVMLQDGGLPPAARPIPLLHHVAGMYSNPRSVDELVHRLGIDSFAKTSIRRLSGGQKQRVAMAASLVGNPEVLFLDEPSAGLDPQSRMIVFELIRELRDEGIGIILTTHLMDDAQRLADYVFIVAHGRTVAHGTVPQLLSVRESTTPTDRILTFEATEGLNLSGILPPAGDGGPDVVETRPGSYEISGAITPDHLAAVALWWAKHGIMPTSLALAPRTLEEVFLEISGREIR